MKKLRTSPAWRARWPERMLQWRRERRSNPCLRKAALRVLQRRVLLRGLKECNRSDLIVFALYMIYKIGCCAGSGV